jgi:hypothetical protein
MDQIALNASTSLAGKLDEKIMEIITRMNNDSPLDLEDIRQNLSLEIVGGVSRYVWRGTPILEFMPIEIVRNGLNVKFTQRYRKLV